MLLVLFALLHLTALRQSTLMDKVREALVKDDVSTVIDLCSRAVASAPSENTFAFTVLGDLYKRRGNFKLAIHNYESYIKYVKSPDLEVYGSIYDCYIKSGNLDHAADFIKKYESEFSNSPQKFVDWRNELMLLSQQEGLANQYIDQKQHGEAVKILEHLEQRMTHKKELIKTLVKCYIELSFNDKVASRLRRLVAMDPNDTEGILIFVNFLYDSCNIFDALSNVQKCLRVDQDNKECKQVYQPLRRVKNFYEKIVKMLEDKSYGNLLPSIQNLEKFLTQKSIDKPCLNHFILRAKCHAMAENVDDADNAMKICNEAIRFFAKDSPEYLELLRSRINIYINISELELAKSDVQILLQYYPEDEKTSELSAKINRLIKAKGKRDYYKILGVKKSDSKKVIMSAYRKKALQNHPDKVNGTEDKKRAEARMKDINDARDVLTDQNKKNMFDSGRDPFDPEEEYSHHNRHHSHGGHRTVFVDPNNFNFFGQGNPFTFNF